MPKIERTRRDQSTGLCCEEIGRLGSKRHHRNQHFWQKFGKSEHIRKKVDRYRKRI